MGQEISKFHRRIDLSIPVNPLTGSGAAFLWGARQTGKSTLLRERFPDALVLDLLDTSLAADLAVQPRRLRERVLADEPETVVIDEVQYVPTLLPEVHWLLENTATRFILCGSSARKLRRESSNLLGGRAVDHYLHPLTTAEIGDVDLGRLLRFGALPVHYLSNDPKPLLRAYINNYLKQEIIDESVTRNIPAFSRFLQTVAIGHGQQVNHSNVARETGVSASTVRNYYQILEDTLLGFTLEPWKKKKRRRLVDTAKFYLFDVGVANQLHPEATNIGEGTDLYGRAFEHFIINEVRAWIEYEQLDLPITFWRTSSGLEVDLIVGDLDLAVECKSSREVRQSDLKGVRGMLDELTPKRTMVVSREPHRRKTEDGIEIVSWQDFCEELWGGKLLD